MNLEDPIVRKDPIFTEARAWLTSDQLLPRLLEAITQAEAEEGYLIGEDDNAAQLLLECVNRTSVRITGDTGGGKNTLVDSVTRILPDGWVKKITGWTDKALRWLPEDSSIHVLYIAEMKGLGTGEESTSDFDMKLTISEGELVIMYPEKKKDGRMETVERHVRVDQFIFTTTGITIPRQLENRIATQHIKDSRGQTRDVINSQNTKAKRFAFRDYSSELKVAKAALGIVLENTKDMGVVIPFAESLASILPDERTDTRRRGKEIRGLLKASTKLHYLSRQRFEANGKTWLVATLQDLWLVLGICGSNLEQELGTIDAKMKQALDICKGLETITAPAVVKEARRLKASELYSGSTVGDIFRALRERGILIQKTDSEGKELHAYHGAKVYEIAQDAGDYLIIDNSRLLASAWAEAQAWGSKGEGRELHIPLAGLLGSTQSREGIVTNGAGETTVDSPLPIGTNQGPDSVLPDNPRRGVDPWAKDSWEGS